jgi:protein-S-isoprenylcysteine O-methyltransferase Ste14
MKGFPFLIPASALPQTPDTAFIGLCFLVFGVTWLIGAFFTKRTVERSATFWRLFAVILVLVLASGTISRALPDITLWPQSRTSGLAADALAALGLYISLWARFTLGSNWSGDVTFKENHKLITWGPYAFVRHPIYTGMLTMFAGSATLIGHAQSFLFVAAIALSFWLKARVEERMMMKHFPDEYPAYKARVPALIPFV